MSESITTAFRPRGAAGRWNSKGTVLVYTAEHPALAAFEMLCAWDDYEDFSRYQLYRCEFNENAVRDALSDLDRAQLDARDMSATQHHGDSWVAGRDSAVLRVPSVVAPVSYNYLLNPDYPDFDQVVKRSHIGPFQYDERILSLLSRAKKQEKPVNHERHRFP